MKKDKTLYIISIIIISLSSIISAFALGTYLNNSDKINKSKTIKGAKDELYQPSTGYTSLNPRVSTLESYFNDNTSEINIVGTPVKINGNDMTGIGTLYVKDGTQKAIATGSGYKLLGDFELPSAGTWFVTISYLFGSSTTGYRIANVFTDSGLATSASTIGNAQGAGAATNPTRLKSTFVLRPTAAKTYYVGVYHNAGANLNCNFRVQAVRIL